MSTPVRRHFDIAAHHVQAAILHLGQLHAAYEASEDLPPGVRMARMRSLNAKMDALRAVQFDAGAVPWVDDV